MGSCLNSPKDIRSGTKFGVKRQLVSVVELERKLAVTPPGDLDIRMRQSERTLCQYLVGVGVIKEMYRVVNASLDPIQIANALVARAAVWLPAASWGVVGPGSPGSGVLMAERGLASDAEVVAKVVGAWVLRHSREYSSANAGKDLSIENVPDLAVTAFPLRCRDRTIGALVGIDRGPSMQSPYISPKMLGALAGVLEPAAIGLDNAFRVRQAEELSITDDLTKLYNSRYLSQILRDEVKRSISTERPLSLLFIDLDGFKVVNDLHGHLCGSSALVEAAILIRECSRETDVVARFGGDEFAMVLSDTGVDGALAVAGRVLEGLSGHVFLTPHGIKCRLTASVGVATIPDSADTVEDLLEAADDAIYWVKAHGKNGIRFSRSGIKGDISA